MRFAPLPSKPPAPQARATIWATGLCMLLVLARCAPAQVGSSLQEPPLWTAVAPGLDAAVGDTVPTEQHPSSRVQLLRVDPEHWSLSPHHYKSEGLDAPPSLEEWLERTGAPAVFNAGFYYEDFRHIGLLLRDGKNLGTALHPKWKGLLVADPRKSGLPSVDILDLLETDFSVEEPEYRVAVQSLMILKNGKKRVGPSDKLGSRTAVAVDEEGRLLVVWVEGPVSLWSLADVLDRSGLGIVRAVTMDGGREAQIGVQTAKTHVRRYGMSAIGAIGLIQGPVALPAVVAVEPKQREAEQP